MMINGRGRGCNAGKGGLGRGIAAVETRLEHEYMDATAGRGGRGGRNWLRFGRGLYRT